MPKRRRARAQLGAKAGILRLACVTRQRARWRMCHRAQCIKATEANLWKPTPTRNASLVRPRDAAGLRMRTSSNFVRISARHSSYPTPRNTCGRAGLRTLRETTVRGGTKEVDPRARRRSLPRPVRAHRSGTRLDGAVAARLEPVVRLRERELYKPERPLLVQHPVAGALSARPRRGARGPVRGLFASLQGPRDGAAGVAMLASARGVRGRHALVAAEVGRHV